MATERMTVRAFARLKGKRITVLTAYDYFTAKYLDRAGVDSLLVGDSLNMVFYGEATTLSADMPLMLAHTRAVAKAAKRALVIGDMPFLSYQTSERDAIYNAGLFLKEAGAQAVKMEGGVERMDTIKKTIEAGIPVMGHIGLVPQSIHRFGGYQVQGRDEQQAAYLKESALALAEAGVFGMVLEAIPTELARQITESVKVPTIGIGAGPHCDGQVMVINDIAGLFDEFKPKFVRRYGDLAAELERIARAFVDDVHEGRFPGPDESYG